MTDGNISRLPPRVRDTRMHFTSPASSRLDDRSREVAREHNGPCDRAELSLRLEVPETPVWVRGDDIRLRQVVGHLLENACAFTDPGGRIAVRLGVEGDERQVVLRIRDTGVGIDP